MAAPTAASFIDVVVPGAGLVRCGAGLNPIEDWNEPF